MLKHRNCKTSHSSSITYKPVSALSRTSYIAKVQHTFITLIK